MKIAIGSDHAGYDYRRMLISHLEAAGHEIIDCGCEEKVSCDYPVYGRKAARLVKSGACERGVVICGTGFGISLAANRLEGIRCVSFPHRQPGAGRHVTAPSSMFRLLRNNHLLLRMPRAPRET